MDVGALNRPILGPTAINVIICMTFRFWVKVASVHITFCHVQHTPQPPLPNHSLTTNHNNNNNAAVNSVPFRKRTVLPPIFTTQGSAQSRPPHNRTLDHLPAHCRHLMCSKVHSNYTLWDQTTLFLWGLVEWNMKKIESSSNYPCPGPIQSRREVKCQTMEKLFVSQTSFMAIKEWLKVANSTFWYKIGWR